MYYVKQWDFGFGLYHSSAPTVGKYRVWLENVSYHSNSGCDGQGTDDLSEGIAESIVLIQKQSGIPRGGEEYHWRNGSLYGVHNQFADSNPYNKQSIVIAWQWNTNCRKGATYSELSNFSLFIMIYLNVLLSPLCTNFSSNLLASSSFLHPADKLPSNTTAPYSW